MTDDQVKLLAGKIDALGERMDERFGDVEHRFEQVDKRFEEAAAHRQKLFDLTGSMFEYQNGRIAKLEERFDSLVQKPEPERG